MSMTEQEWEDQLFERMVDPSAEDELGESEYRTIYEHIQNIVESANVSEDAPREWVYATLDELTDAIARIRRDCLETDEYFENREDV